MVKLPQWILNQLDGRYGVEITVELRTPSKPTLTLAVRKGGFVEFPADIPPETQINKLLSIGGFFGESYGDGPFG